MRLYASRANAESMSQSGTIEGRVGSARLLSGASFIDWGFIEARFRVEVHDIKGEFRFSRLGLNAHSVSKMGFSVSLLGRYKMQVKITLYDGIQYSVKDTGVSCGSVAQKVGIPESFRELRPQANSE